MDYDDQMVYAKTILERYPPQRPIFRRLFPISAWTSPWTHPGSSMPSSTSGPEIREYFPGGDEDQSIYGFRAAYPDALMQFERTYPGAWKLLMEENYRSTPEILRTADAFIRRNHDRRPKTIRPTRASRRRRAPGPGGGPCRPIRGGSFTRRRTPTDKSPSCTDVSLSPAGPARDTYRSPRRMTSFPPVSTFVLLFQRNFYGQSMDYFFI